MSRNLEAKITKQMRDLIEAKIKKQNISPEQAISDMSVFMGDFDESDKHLIHQYAKYIKHLIDSQLETRNAWEKFLDKVEEHHLNKKLGKAISKESLSDKEAFKQSLDDLKEYDKISKILKSPSNKPNKIEDIKVANKDDNEVFNPFDEQAAAELADIEAAENDHDDWTINDEEFNDDQTIDTSELGTLERNIDFSDTTDVEQLKEEFSKVKSQMQAKIDDLSQQVDTLKFKLADYQIKELDDYEIADESDDEELNDKLLAQKVPDGQQTMDFSVDHTKEKLEDIKPEEEPEDQFAKTQEQTISLDDLDEDFSEKPEEESVSEDEMLKTSEQTTVFTEPEKEETVDLEDDMAKGLSEALGEEITVGEMEPTAVFGFDSVVVDKDGNEYHIAGSRKNSENHTDYLVRNEDGETFTINSHELKQK